MAPKANSKKATPAGASRSGTPITASKSKSSAVSSLAGTPEKPLPSKKGRKRKNPLPDDAALQGPGRPKKKKIEASTPVPEPSTPVGKGKPKKMTKKQMTEAAAALMAEGAATPTTASPAKPAKEKKMTKKQMAAAAKVSAADGAAEAEAKAEVKEKAKPKKKYQKLTQEEREARRQQKKQATEEAKRLKQQQKQKQSAKPKERPPVDVERQCGVPLENGGFCARSLTCKTHSMGAKRAVPGRSKPYDALLAAYQKRNQVKLAELSTQQQLEKENEAFLGAQPLTEEEEIAQVMAGVFESKPMPLERRVILPIRQKTKFFRMREMLITALNKPPPIATLTALASSVQNQQGTAQSSIAQNRPGQVQNTEGNDSADASTSASKEEKSTDTKPTLPSSSDGPQSSSAQNLLTPQHIGEIMNNTTSIYGRSLVYDTTTGESMTLPSQALYASRILKHHNLLRQRRLQQMQMEQQLQQRAMAAQSQGIQMQAQGSVPGQMQNPQQMVRSSSNPGFTGLAGSNMLHMVANNGFQQM